MLLLMLLLLMLLLLLLLLMLLLLLLLMLKADIRTGGIFSQEPQETNISCEYSGLHSSVFEDCSFVG
jgi:hypothetical protein